MTEADWLRSAEPYVMLQLLRGQVSSRKLRLFAVACCRRIWEQLSDVRSVMAVEIAERFADGRVEESALTAAVQAARRAYENALNIHDSASFAPVWLGVEPLVAAENVSMHCARSATSADRESESQADLLRDIFGNPFRPTPVLDPPWQSWNDNTVSRLAQQMYDSRDFASMPILADALEEAGCTSGDVLDHCRGPGPHVRGCWVVDRILGKE